MPVRQAPEHRLFAMYLEMTRDDGTNRRRHQWLVLPPLSQELATSYSVLPRPDNFLVFNREQLHSTNRSKWHFTYEATKPYIERLRQVSLNYESAAWKASPVITVEVGERELAELHHEPKTPYRVLDRVIKVAKAKYNLAI